MARGSSKPCPGCGEVDSSRPAKEVCRACKHLLQRAKWLEEELSKLGDDKVVVKFGKLPHWNEYIHTKSDVGRGLMDIFQRLAEAGSCPSAVHSSEFRLLGKIDAFSGARYAVMLSPLAEAIRDLRVAVGEALKLEYEQGKKDGHNLLFRLASGDLSGNEFNAIADKE